MAQDSIRPPGSRLLHLIDRVTSRPAVAWVVVGAAAAWMVLSVVIGFPSRLETIFQTSVAAITLAMVFVIQHTAAREQIVTQRKLDEVLAALPQASNALIGLEDAPDEVLDAVHSDHRRLRRGPTS